MTAIANPQAFVFVGCSASGKGTQAALLMNYLQKQAAAGSEVVFHVETGARFREHIKGTTYSSQLSQKVMAEGGRQPDFLAVWIWTDVLVRTFTGGQHLVLDGTPRSLCEALALDTAFDFYGYERPHILYLDLPRAVALERLSKRGRIDDLDQAGNEKRLAWFAKDVRPAIDYYLQNPKYHFVRLDATQSIEAIHRAAIQAIC